MKHSAPQIEPEPAIPDDNAPLPPARRGSRWTVRRGRAIAFVLLGLALAVSLLSVYATYQAAADSAAQSAAVDQRLTVLEQDLAERREQRDQERDQLAARVEEFVDYLCAALSQQPAGQPTLDDLREALACADPSLAPPPPSTPPPAPGAAAARPSPASPPNGRTAPPATPGGQQQPTGTAPALPPAQPAPPAPLPPPPAPAAPEPPDRGLLGDLLCSLPLLC